MGLDSRSFYLHLLSFNALYLIIHIHYDLYRTINLILSMKPVVIALLPLLWGAGKAIAGKLSLTDTITWGGDNSRTGYQPLVFLILFPLASSFRRLTSLKYT